MVSSNCLFSPNNNPNPKIFEFTFTLDKEKQHLLRSEIIIAAVKVAVLLQICCGCSSFCCCERCNNSNCFLSLSIKRILRHLPKNNKTLRDVRLQLDCRLFVPEAIMTLTVLTRKSLPLISQTRSLQILSA